VKVSSLRRLSRSIRKASFKQISRLDPRRDRGPITGRRSTHEYTAFQSELRIGPWASARLRKICSLRHSLRKRLLNDSTNAFCILHWLAGRNVVPVEPPDRPVQYRDAGQSQPLWLTITLGPPRSITESSSSRTTRTPPIEVSTTPADISSGSVDQRTLYIREPKVDDQQNRAVHRRRLLFEHVPPPVVIGATESATDGLVRTIGVLLAVHNMDGSYGRR
jgi:hypothetical protein